MRLIAMAATTAAAVREQPRVNRLRSQSCVSGEKDSEGGSRAAARNVLTYLKRQEPLKPGRDPQTCRLKKVPDVEIIH